MTDDSEPLRELREEIARLAEIVANTNHPPQLMTTAECAEFLRRGPDVIYEWRKNGMGPPHLPLTERTILYDRDAVLEWARSHEVK